MTEVMSFDRAVQDWLDDGDDRTAPATLDAVLLAVRTTPQARTVPWPWSSDPSPTRVRQALAGLAVVLLVVAVGGSFLPVGSGGGGPVESPTPTPSASASSSPSASASPSPSASASSSPSASANPSPSPSEPSPALATPSSRLVPAERVTTTQTALPAPSALPLPTTGALAAGTYAFERPSGVSADYQKIIFTVPEGWVVGSDGIARSSPSGGDPAETQRPVSLTFWSIDDVYDDPCHWETSSLSKLDLVGHADEIDGLRIRDTGGLLHQQDHTVTNLQTVNIGTQRALRLDALVPATLSLASCDGGQDRVWTTQQGGFGLAVPGQMDVIWQVDVDRRPLVIVASHPTGASPSDLAELQSIVDSIVIVR